MSPSLGLFDHRYHTYERTVGLPVLFTVIVAVSSRYLGVQSSPRIIDLAEKNMDTAISTGDHDLALVQAMLVNVVWLKESDPAVNIKLGIISRLLSQLQLVFFAQPPAPYVNDDEERKAVDIDRTVFGEP